MLVLSLLAATTFAPDLPPLPNSLLREKDALMLDEPEVVSAGRVEQLSWHPSVGYLMFYRTVDQGLSLTRQYGQGVLATPPPKVGSVNIYSSTSKRVTTPLRIPVDGALDEFEWIPGSSKGLATLTQRAPSLDATPGEEQTWIVWVSAAGESKRIASASHNNVTVYVSPTKAKFAVVAYVPPGTGDTAAGMWTRMFDAEGKMLSSHTSPPGTGYRWSADGNVLYETHRRREGTKLFADWYVYASDSGQPEKLKTAPKLYQPPAPKEALTARIVEQKSSLNERDTNSIGILSDAATGKSMVVSSDCAKIEVSPDLTSVAYIHKGIVMLRPIVKIPKDTYLALQIERAKRDAILNAKQAALAAIMYSADADDMLISNTGDWRNTLKPYLMNDDILANFVLVYPGGSAAAVENPATTVMGYIEAPGGRAVAYIDGHVKWEPNP